jgi:hypothetical protein
MSPEFCRHCGGDLSDDALPGSRQRSSAQNRYMHKEPFPKLAAKFGESIGRTKLILMGEFWGYEPCRVTGVLLPVKCHTADMTVAETTTFLDWLIPWALTEHGVEIDLPPVRTREAVSA